MANITVLGANGFIGKHLVRQLAKDQKNKIKAFDRFPEYLAGQKVYFNDLSNVEIIQGDFFNRESIGQALDDTEYVFHLVSTTTPAVSAKDPYIDIDTNIRGSVVLFELCVKKGVKRIIFPSSGGTVYGETDRDNIDENTLPQPISPYGIGKLTIEHYLNFFNKTQGLDFIAFRIANPYGPGQNLKGNQGVIPIFLNSALNNKTLNIYGDGSMIRDYIYIDDLISMIMSSYNKKHKYNIYNISSGKGSSINELVKSIENHLNKNLAIKNSPVPKTFIHKSVLDSTRFISEFKIQPETSLESGIKKTLNHLKESSSF